MPGPTHPRTTSPFLSLSLSVSLAVLTDLSISGTPPQVKREVADYIKPMQAGALSAASAMTLLVASMKVVLTNPADTKSLQQIVSYTQSINVALDSLVTAMKSARDAKMM